MSGLKIAFSCILIFCWGNSLLAQDARKYLFNQADSLLKQENYEQAGYYFSLAYQQEGEFPTDQQILEAIFSVDSLEAYSAADLVFKGLISNADSLVSVGQSLQAIKLFDETYNAFPKYRYPLAKIDQIISASPEIKQQILILQAKRNQLSFKKMLEDLDQMEQRGDFIEAYFAYKDLAKIYHQDSIFVMGHTRIMKEHQSVIEKFESLISKGEHQYQKGNYEKSEILFSEALKLNPACKECEVRLNYISFYIKNMQSNGVEFDEMLEVAEVEFKQGKYESAYYHLAWLQKKQPHNERVKELIVEVEELVESESDQRLREFNADITLEKANNAFLSQNFEEALSEYLKLKNAYLDIIDYDEFVEIRIAECLVELEQ